ncbi:MAG: ATP-binding cassette domain-containing protein [Chloroflexi bacterium]|nr:ATP-binding cassette domain-containing protein [Chloroflexota bacterium]
MDNNLIEIKNLKMYFPVVSGALLPRKGSEIKAVDDVSFNIRRGETFGLVGESGSGKTTLGMCLLQLYRPTAGEVLFQQTDLCKLRGKELRQVRRHIQAIFQDPYGSLNPRMNAADIISEPLNIHHLTPRREYSKRVEEMLSLVGLDPAMAHRYPHEFSAGERQRIGIARALTVGPEFIVCDEPVSSLDVCVQAQIIHLLEDLQSRLNLTYLFIAHDLAVVGSTSNHVAVMYRGRLVELGTRDHIFDNPLHPYTRALLSAVPVPDPTIEKERQRMAVTVDVAEAFSQPGGCSFRSHCAEAADTCREATPVMEMKEPEHWIACWRS